jgi:MoxR-like ATPase
LADGRAHVAFEDIRHYANEVLQHRILLNYDGQAENVRSIDLIQECLRNLNEDGGSAWA